MTIKIFNYYYDHVIDSWFLNGETDYAYALKYIFPRVGEFDAQRKMQNGKFYERLRKDIVKGCVMPPVTIAFVDEQSFEADDSGEGGTEKVIQFSKYVVDNISSVYVLDGMQRLNTLNSASADAGFNSERRILLNVLISKSNDKLLYRMITLNNGQRPMTPRHQIEILTRELFDFSKFKNIVVQTEKERGDFIIRGAFNFVDISNAYLAFLTGNVNNENSRIIEDKMNEILVGRLFDSEISEQGVEFSDLLRTVDKFCENNELKSWFKVNNNFIGFSVGYKKSYNFVNRIDVDVFAGFIKNFENAFDAINPSKVNVGKIRRELSALFVGDMEQKLKMDPSAMMEFIADLTAQ